MKQIEKPFGKDLESSRELQRALAPDWKEEEIFRIDHYLGKEMVKNLLVLRFGNSFFQANWSKHYIDNVQVCCEAQVAFVALLMQPRSLLRSRSVPRAVVAILMSSTSFATSVKTVWSHRSVYTSKMLTKFRFAAGPHSPYHGAPPFFLRRGYSR